MPGGMGYVWGRWLRFDFVLMEAGRLQELGEVNVASLCGLLSELQPFERGNLRVVGHVHGSGPFAAGGLRFNFGSDSVAVVGLFALLVGFVGLPWPA